MNRTMNLERKYTIMQLKFLIELPCSWISTYVSFVALNFVCSTPFSRWILSGGCTEYRIPQGVNFISALWTTCESKTFITKESVIRTHDNSTYVDTCRRKSSVSNVSDLFSWCMERYGCTTSIYRWRMLLVTRDQHEGNIFTDESSRCRASRF